MNTPLVIKEKRNEVYRDQDQWTPNLSPDRIQALSDGVIAIAITILVLELPAPHLLGDSTPEVHATSFQNLWAEFYIYVTSFLALGVYWILHHYVFHFIRRSNGVLVWLNILFLMFASLVPYSAKVLMLNDALSPGNATWNEASVFFGIIMIGTLLILLAMWRYATHGHRLVSDNMDSRTVVALNKIIVVGVIAMIISTGLSYFVPAAGVASLIGMVYIIGATAHGRHRPAA